MGLGGSIILRLVQGLPENENFKVFLQASLRCLSSKIKGFYSIGVLKANRMCGAVLTSKELKRGGRGTMDARTSTSGDIAIVRWQDNNIVNLASTFLGVGDVDKVRRWSKSEKRFIEVEQPEAVKVYNIFMGGVDFLDRLISYYPMTMRKRRWPPKVILHLLSLTVATCWIEYRERELKKSLKKKQIIDFLAFRDEIVQSLCKTECNQA